MHLKLFSTVRIGWDVTTVAAGMRTSQHGNHFVLTIAIKLALRLGKHEFSTGRFLMVSISWKIVCPSSASVEQCAVSTKFLMSGWNELCCVPMQSTLLWSIVPLMGSHDPRPSQPHKYKQGMPGNEAKRRYFMPSERNKMWQDLRKGTTSPVSQDFSIFGNFYDIISQQPSIRMEWCLAQYKY